MTSRIRAIHLGVLALLVALVGATGTAQQSTPPGRLTVAVLRFADKSGEQQLSHWRCAVSGLICEQLAEAKAIRVLPASAVDYAFRQLAVKKGSSLDAGQARKMGELIEAQRVVWGCYQRRNGQWQVCAFVLNVASGKASGELVVSSADWFELRDELAGQILAELGIKPSESEREKMSRLWRTCPSALESYSRARALQEEDKPFREQEESLRKALAADPQFTKAHLALAAALYGQGRLEEAKQAVRRALELEPDCADGHLILGILQFFSKKPVEAERELRKAHDLDPEDNEPLIRLSELCAAQQKWDEAITSLNEARALDPTDAGVHARLGLMYAHKRNRDQALAQLRQAERFDLEGLAGVNAEQMICQAYTILGEVPLAVEHHERFVTYAKKLGANPKLVGIFEERARQLKATLTSTFIEASMPQVYTHQTLQEVLRERLTVDELNMVVDPLAGSAEMKRWAEQLTEHANGDLEKAKALFEGLTRRVEAGDGHGHRTAKEVFTVWNDPDVSFICTWSCP